MIDINGTITINGQVKTTHCTRHTHTIQQIMASAIKPYNITHFHHMRMFNNGSHIAFCTRPELIEYAYDSGWFHSSKMFQNNLSHCLSQIMLWPKHASGADAHHFGVVSECFNISHGVSVVERAKKFVDFFHFGTHRDNHSFESIFLTQLPLLKSIIFFYKDKAAKLIKENRNELVYAPRNSIQLNAHLELFSSKASLPNFDGLENISRYYIDDFYITKRELDILRLLAQGYSAKQTGEILSLSFKTIESVVSVLKEKFKCRKVTQLVAKAYEYYLAT